MKIKKVYVLLCSICMTVISCVKDVDFDQREDIVFTPVYEVDFIYSRLATSQFIDSGIDPAFVVPEVIKDDISDFNFLGENFPVNDLERLELTFEFTNTIVRDLGFDFGFLNNSGQRIGPLYSMIANSGKGAGIDPVVTTKVIVLDKTTINTLRDATKLFSSIKVQNVNSDLQGVLELRSKGAYFFKYKL